MPHRLSLSQVLLIELGTIVANAGTTLTGAGGLACGVACTVSIGADSTNYTGVINTPSFTKQGSGTLTLSGSNTIGSLLQ